MKKTWSHKKYGKRQYVGTYNYDGDEREFVLFGAVKGKKAHRIVFESPQMALKLGWVYK